MLLINPNWHILSPSPNKKVSHQVGFFLQCEKIRIQKFTLTGIEPAKELGALLRPNRFGHRVRMKLFAICQILYFFQHEYIISHFCKFTLNLMMNQNKSLHGCSETILKSSDKEKFAISCRSEVFSYFHYIEFTTVHTS